MRLLLENKKLRAELLELESEMVSKMEVMDFCRQTFSVEVYSNADESYICPFNSDYVFIMDFVVVDGTSILMVMTSDGDNILMFPGWCKTGQCLPGQGACRQDSTDSGSDQNTSGMGETFTKHQTFWWF